MAPSKSEPCHAELLFATCVSTLCRAVIDPRPNLPAVKSLTAFHTVVDQLHRGGSGRKPLPLLIEGVKRIEIHRLALSGRMCHNSGNPSGRPLTCASMGMQGVQRQKGNYAYSAASGIWCPDRLVQTGRAREVEIVGEDYTSTDRIVG